MPPEAFGVRDSYGLHAGGHERRAASGRTRQLFSPATGLPLTTVAEGGVEDVNLAIEAATAAALTWRRTSWQERAAVLHGIADVLASDVDRWAWLDVQDAGIPIAGMRRDVANAISYLRYFAGLCTELRGSSVDVGTGGLNASVREPFGVVGRIVPFNHPLQFAAQALAAPLAAGNAVVLKPAEQTPVSALHLAALFAGRVPDGTVNVIPGGAEVGAAIVGHPAVPRIGFTGSVATGRHVMRQAAEHIKEVSLELGGKNPLLVLPDADLDTAVSLALVGMNLQRTAGQSCGSTSRVYVPRSMASEFASRLGEAVGALVIGDPGDDRTEVGPLAYAEHRDRVVSMVDHAVAQGARLVTGGGPRPELGQGYYVEPAVLDTVSEEMVIASEEVFGPVIAILDYDDVDDAVDRANALPLGLTANVVTRDLDAAMTLAHRLEVGFVWINGRGQRPFGAPFGGYKLSGIGRENSIDELLSYTRIKNINISRHQEST